MTWWPGIEEDERPVPLPKDDQGASEDGELALKYRQDLVERTQHGILTILDLRYRCLT